MRGGAAEGEGGDDGDAEGRVLSEPEVEAPPVEAPARPDERGAPPSEPARKRAAVELISRHGHLLRQTARRYSLCAEDAEDAYQRGLEILLVKAPSERQLELLAWSRTVIKHEALAIRHHRERLLAGAGPVRGGEGSEDRVARIPAPSAGPEERFERSERIARSREALRALKPAELRALTLLAEGYSYAEIGEITGFSRTKINRCLAEGRERFRRLVSRSEDGSRCAEMGPLLSAFCDGQASAEQSEEVRDHLRACAGCRATLRAYRAAPGAAAALAPALPAWRVLLERGQELLSGLTARLPGGGGAEAGVAGAAAGGAAAGGGAGGGGIAAVAKLVAVCAGTAGSAACVATGVAPVPLDLTPERAKAPRIERVAERAYEAPAPAPPEEPRPEPAPPAEPEAPPPAPAQEPAPAPAPESAAGAVEYTPPPPPSPSPAPSGSAGQSSGSAAGEFGP